MDDSARCNLCGYCVKNCPNDSITISARIPSTELWFIRKPKFEESFLAIIIMGIVFVQNITMLQVWGRGQRGLESLLGTTDPAITFTATFVVAMAIPVLMLFAASWTGSRINGEKTFLNFARFVYALIPLDLAGHLAHNLFHLLAEGGSILITGLALIGSKIPIQSTALVSMSTIELLQFSLLALGGFASAYTAYRIAKFNYRTAGREKSYIPYVILIGILVAFNVYLFLLPMSHRM